MSFQPFDPKLRAKLRLSVRVMLIALRGLLRDLLALARLVLRTALAILIVFEEWGWRPLARALASVSHLPVVARLEAAIQRLPPYGALAVFAVPSLLLVPLKLLAVFLIATGHAVTAACLFIAAKVVGTAVVARLFQLTESQLLQIPWCKRVHDVVMPWKEGLAAWVRTTWAWRYGRVIKSRTAHRIGHLRNIATRLFRA